MDVMEAITRRRSAPGFAPDPVDRAVLERLIAAAVCAPNHHLTQPWRFAVVAGEERARLGERVAQSLAELGAAPSAVEAARSKPLRSPVVVAVIQRREATPDPVRDQEDYAACCCATQNLLLAAFSEGLAAKWSTGAMATAPGARSYFGMGPDDRIVAYVYLGRPTTVLGGEAKRSAPEVSWLGFE